MSVQLLMFEEPTSTATPSAISSQASADGRWLFAWPDGTWIDLFGQAHVPVSRFRVLANKKELPMNDTFGPKCSASSESAALQRSLASKLQAALDVNGSPDYSLTWKEWAMPSREPICALQAKLRHTPDSAFFGLPTPTVNSILERSCPVADGRVRYLASGRVRKSSKKGKEGSMNWSQDVLLRGYLPTPRLVLFLMGYPPEWSRCAELAMPSSRKSRRNS